LYGPTDPLLSDVIKRCLQKSQKDRPDIKTVLNHPFFIEAAKKQKVGLGIASKLGMFASGNLKRGGSQSNRKSEEVLSSVLVSSTHNFTKKINQRTRSGL
jgi:serine/threonine protein kinase